MAPEGPPGASEPPSTATKRPRPVISCLECRRKKLKCDRAYPCQQCVKIGRPGRCQYQRGSEPETNGSHFTEAHPKRPRLDFSDIAKPQESTSTPKPVSNEIVVQSKPGIIEDLQDRVARLEKALISQNEESAASSKATRNSGVDHGRDIVVNNLTKPMFPTACSFMKLLDADTTNDQIVGLRTDLRRIHYTIEAHELRTTQQAQLMPTMTFSLQDLPPENVCASLTELYFDNLEHCFRILHGPDFQRQLKILFTDGQGPTACSFAFLPQLVGVLAMGAMLGTHTECHLALSYPLVQQHVALKFMNDFIAGLNGTQICLLPSLQVKMLALILGWLALQPLGDVFRDHGHILRDALIMRMDRDPSTLPELSIYQGEMRRRIWMTIAEVDLMLSILCKLPCMIPQYTCRPPQNVNDDELFEGMDQLPQSRPMEQWTDGLCQYVLARSYARRLAACKQLEAGDTPIKSDDVLQHIAYLEKELQDLPPPLRFSFDGDEDSKTPPRLMARMELDISIRRPLMHLYSSLAAAQNPDIIRPETRAGFIQSCLMLSVFQDLFDPEFSEINVPRPEGYWDFFYNVYRHELGSAILGLCSEIRHLHRLQSSLSISSSPTPSPQGGGLSSTTYNASANANAPASRVAIPAGNAHHSNSSTPTFRPPTYTLAGMIASVIETLEPMVRRLLYPHAKFKDLVYYTIVLFSIRPGPAGEVAEPEEGDANGNAGGGNGGYDVQAAIINALRKLVEDCHAHLQGKGIQILQTQPGNIVGSADYRIPPGCGPAIGARFDPCWLGFPDLDIFEFA
ncbi:hypothetical protein PV10_07582 [Exophiala mesophila]|uniref:Zn(2)-C6 fungal-type domain-containing protein n=1 Tax=Exophiala mesophila TaxID=212818 RepID=A0A0D1XQ73_EXOME|nr:uncharacterized protein PV10_07582 [Exophiala mesophila]KIV90261.1 hypothetical protein PV10_07582 [Exophiala mesophila]